MKTKYDIDKQITFQLGLLAHAQKNGENEAAIIEKIQELKLISIYLESKPSLGYLKKEKKRISQILDKKDMEFREWADTSIEAHDLNYSERKLMFDNKYNLAQLKIQLKTINFILSK